VQACLPYIGGEAVDMPDAGPEGIFSLQQVLIKRSGVWIFPIGEHPCDKSGRLHGRDTLTGHAELRIDNGSQFETIHGALSS